MWKIHHCSVEKNISCIRSVSLPKNISVQSRDLFIPAETLEYDLYQFNVTVSSIYYSSSSQSVTVKRIEITSTIYIEISPLKINANLVMFGTSEITNPREKDLILDPGYHTIDPDRGKIDPDVGFNRSPQIAVKR